MKLAFKTLTGVCTVLALEVSAVAVSPDASVRQYQAITDRNVFGLRPPPAQQAPTNPPAQLPKITLTGITTILENKRALLKVSPTGLKPADPSKEVSMILAEGQREGGIEVLQINEKRGSVKVNNSGTEMLLTFEKDGAKLPASRPAPGMPPIPSALPTATGMQHNPYPSRGLPALPGRTARSHSSGNLTNPVNSAVGGIPTPTGLPANPAPIPASAEQDLTAEEQAIVSELQRQANATNPTSALLPPTAVSPAPAQPNEAVVPNPAANPALPSRPQNLVPQ